MKIDITHLASEPGLTLTFIENNFSDSAPLVREVFIKGLSPEKGNAAVALGACLLAAEHVGDVIELPFAVPVPFIEAIRLICPQSSSIGPALGNNRSIATGNIDVAARRATRSPIFLPPENTVQALVEWHGDFVSITPNHIDSREFAFGSVFTNANLIAAEPVVDLTMALLAHGTRLRTVHIPSMAQMPDHAFAARIESALDIVGIGLLSA